MSDKAPPSGPRARGEYVEAHFRLTVRGTSLLGPDTMVYVEAELNRVLQGLDVPDMTVIHADLRPDFTQRDSDLTEALHASVKP